MIKKKLAEKNIDMKRKVRAVVNTKLNNRSDFYITIWAGEEI